MRFTTTAIVVFISLINFVWAYAAPGACTGDCAAHDPAVIKDTDGTFWRFWTGGGIYMASAPDISGPWTSKGEALPGGTIISGFSGKPLWAPDVSLHDGTYYMYYAVSQGFGSQNSAIGVATSSSLGGPWIDHGSVGVSSNTGYLYNAIDPNLIQVGTDYYLNFGSFWAGIFQIKMDLSLLTKAAGALPYRIENTLSGFPPIPTAIEGSYMYYRSATGYYYLFTSWGQCCNFNPRPPPGHEYSMRVCRSTSATGGFKDSNGWPCLTLVGLTSGSTMVLASHDNVYAPGHGGVIDIDLTTSVLYYHWLDNNDGLDQIDANKFGWNTITWTAAGWPTV
ncbi:hypothetical protein ABW21_db0205843 [Orbilia brochopaga]|nr:hypothetical protein ABW21_db0205843 [Drechslerella brochopaga]